MSGPEQKRRARRGEPASQPPASPAAGVFDRGLVLAPGEAGWPKLSATVLLDRRPAPGETSIEPLAAQALFAFTARLDVSYFAREATFELRDGGRVLQQVAALGVGPAAAFSLTVDRDDTLRLLAALRGDESGFTVHCRAERSEAASGPPLIVEARLPDILAALGDATLLDREAVAGVAEAMLNQGLLSVSPEGAASRDALADAFLAMARPLLRPVTTGEGRRWRVLRIAPNPMTLSGRAGQAASVPERLGYTVPLETLFAGIGDLDHYVRMLAPDGVGGLGPVPPLRVQRAARASSLVKLGRVAGAGGATQLQALARPAPVKAGAHAMIAAATAQPVAAVASGIKPQLIAIADLHLAGAASASREEHLPRLDDRTAPMWRDQADPGRYWYAPDFALARPAPTDDPDGADFGMMFHAEGHRADGKPGLAGSIRFRLLRQMPAETRTAWEKKGKPTIAPVPADNLSVRLLIPFRDEKGGTRSQAFPASLAVSGDTIEATVELLDDWLRLAYGGLAYEGFQAQAPELSVAYSFRGYVPIGQDNLQLLFDRKQALVALHAGQASRGFADAFLDTETLSWRDGAATLRLAREPASAPMRAVTRRTPSATAQLAIKPNLLQAETVAQLVARRKYGVQSIARAQGVQAMFPCAEFGSFYREETVEGIKAIGCQDAFRLGQTVYRQYERIDDLSDGAASVWRSLQQPGRFLLVPRRWSIARFGGDEPGDRAWRPAIFVYSKVDPDDAAGNRCALLASLMPDVDPVRVLEIRRALRAFAPDPQLVPLADIDAEASFRWTVPTLDGLTVNAVRLEDCIQVTAECPLDTMPLLSRMIETAGLAGSVSFALPDGTTLESDLRVDLARIAGPAPDGPLEIGLHEDRLTLTNPIERAIDIGEIVVDTAGGDARTVAVDRRLEPGQSVDVDAAVGDAMFAVRCVPAGGGAGLSEIRSFVEDVHSNVAFVNLVNYQVHALAALSIEARIREIDGSQQILLDENEPVSSLDFVLPLTRYLASPVLEYAVTKSFTDGTTARTGWLEWNLADDGNVVSLTWEQIA